MSTPLPDESEAWIDPIYDAIVSEAQLSGYFDKVQMHEPKSKPGYGLLAAVWLQAMGSLPEQSGLDKSSALVVFILRIYGNMLQKPEDEIDPNMMRAGANFMRRLHDDYDFGLHPLVRNVDLLGVSGVALELNSGYVDLDSGKYRVMDIQIPVIVNDVWTQNSTG